MPETLREKVMRIAHDNIFGGHLGSRKTQDKIAMHFYWPGCFSEIRRYCQSCAICQKNNVNKPPKVPLVNIPVIGKPFSKVSFDLIGPLPKSQKGNRFALVSVDLATKYPDAIALKNITAENVAEAMLEIYARVGLPDEILHDQGTQFMSAVMKRFNTLLQIRSVKTSPYNAKCNGSCENFNKTLKQMLKKVSEDKPQTWDRYLQPLLFAYREVPHSSTGFSPFELLFGHEVRGPLFLIKERILNLDSEEDEFPITSFVLEMREKISEYLSLANNNERVAKIKEKVYYDKTTKKRQLSVGNKVLLLLPTSHSKLMAEWKGPFEVIQKINPVNYKVRINNADKVYHINMLKLFHERKVNDKNNIDNCATHRKIICKSPRTNST